jgi:hypothetical protein
MFFDSALVATLKLKEKTFEENGNEARGRGFAKTRAKKTGERGIFFQRSRPKNSRRAL